MANEDRQTECEHDRWAIDFQQHSFCSTASTPLSHSNGVGGLRGLRELYELDEAGGLDVPNGVDGLDRLDRLDVIRMSGMRWNGPAGRDRYCSIAYTENHLRQ